MDPFIYNIFSNDLLLHVTRNIYNYADDNTASAWDKTVDDLNNKLTAVSCLVLQWLTEHYMQANALKFQYILFRSYDNFPDNNVLHIQNGVDLKAECWVTVLGVDFDQSLSFNDHISRICKKAGRQAAKCTFQIIKHFNS